MSMHDVFFPFLCLHTHTLYIYIYRLVALWNVRVGMLFFPPPPTTNNQQPTVIGPQKWKLDPGIFHVIIGAHHRYRIYVQTLQHPAIFFDGDPLRMIMTSLSAKLTWNGKDIRVPVPGTTIEAIGTLTKTNKSNPLKYKWKTSCLSSWRVKYSRILYYSTNNSERERERETHITVLKDRDVVESVSQRDAIEYRPTQLECTTTTTSTAA